MADRQRQTARDLRTRIAHAAARILAEEGVASFHAAKQKAAERLGAAPDARQMPNNREVELALAEYQRLFMGSEHAQRIRRLRRVALDAMKFLQEFSPRLTGPVLSGTASAGTPVTLHVFHDVPEAVGLFLHEHGIPSELRERRFRGARDEQTSQPAYCFIADDVDVEVVVFPAVGLRQAPASPVDGRPMQRADRATVEALIAADDDDAYAG